MFVHVPNVFDEGAGSGDGGKRDEAIYELDGDRMILMMAHRLSTVRRADTILMLERGRKVGKGTYEELAHRHAKFRSIFEYTANKTTTFLFEYD